MPRGQTLWISDLDLYVVMPWPAVDDSRLHQMWGRFDASPEYQAVLRAGYRPTPSPIPHTVDDLARHPWILLDIALHGVILDDPERVLAHELVRAAAHAGLVPRRAERGQQDRLALMTTATCKVVCLWT